MLYEFTIPQFKKTLHNLSHLLDKGVKYAETKKFEPDVWTTMRLAPDMFPLTRQVQIACDTAKLCASRLTGKDAPVFEDNEKTIPELKARIEKTIGYLNTFSAKDFNGAEEKRITTPRWEGKTLSGWEYATQHALPNIYFHTTATYAILRNNGVDVGKTDFLGELPFKK